MILQLLQFIRTSSSTVFNGVNFYEWRDQVDFHLGASRLILIWKINLLLLLIQTVRKKSYTSDMETKQ